MHKRRTFSLSPIGVLALLVGIVQAADPLPPDALPKGVVPTPVATFNFDTDSLGKPPSRFTLAITGEGSGVRWEVRRDLHAPSPPNILVQSGKAKPGDNFALALLDGIVLDHGEIAVRFKPLSGEEAESAGIIFRYQDPKNYYVIVANAQEETCSLLRVKNGKRKEIDSKDVIITPLVWHDLHVIFANEKYTALIGKELILGGKDSSLQKPGQVGLWTQSDSQAAFDDFRVSK